MGDDDEHFNVRRSTRIHSFFNNQNEVNFHSRTTMSNLPNELLLMILLNYNFELDDLKACRLVNKFWKEIVTPKFKSKNVVELSRSSRAVRLNQPHLMQKFCKVFKKTLDLPFNFYYVHCSEIDLETWCKFFSDYGQSIQELWIFPASMHEINFRIKKPTKSQSCFRKIIHAFKSTPNLTRLTLEFVCEGVANPFEKFPKAVRSISNFNNLQKLKYLNLRVYLDKGALKFSKKILLRASNIEQLTLEVSEINLDWEDSRIFYGTEALSKSVSSQKIKKLKLVGGLCHFFANLKPLPQLEELEIERCRIYEEEELYDFTEFLTKHANTLQKLVIKDLSCTNLKEYEFYYTDFPIMPNLKYLQFVVNTGKPIGLTLDSAIMPNLSAAFLTGKTLMCGLNERCQFQNVIKLQLYSDAVQYADWATDIQHRFPNITKLWMMLPSCDSNFFHKVFESLQDFKELTLICCDIKSAQCLLTGMEETDANSIFKNVLAKFLPQKPNFESQNSVSEIQRAASLPLAQGNFRNSIRNMTNLKIFRLKLIPSSSPDVVLSDACVFLTFLQMQPSLETLILDDINVSKGSASLLTSYIRNFYRRELKWKL